MKARAAARAISGILLCVIGFLLARAPLFRETTVVVDAGGCRMVTDVVDSGDDATQGSVVLLHGLAANKKIMSYLARGFALQNLRVFVPDLPGHGRTPGPFSFARAEACSDSFVRQLIARGVIDPTRTILAGHSMGGAIAVRVGSRVPVAGVIAISPAPMVTTYGVSQSMLPFDNPPATPTNTFVLSASAEPRSVRDSARSLTAGVAAASAKYAVIPRATHVSLLFDADTTRASQAWAAQVLKLDSNTRIPPKLPLFGALAGLAGLLLLAGPFLRETVSKNQLRTAGAAKTDKSAYPEEARSPVITWAPGRVLLEVAVPSITIVFLLQALPHAWNPFTVFHVFEGDYLASFFLILGLVLLLIHSKDLPSLRQATPLPLLAAAFAAIVLPLLVYAWLDLTITEAWITPARWLRFPALLAVLLPYHAAEELLLGPQRARFGKARLMLALAFRIIIWAAFFVGIILLHNGEILLLLLAPYFALFCLFQRTGMDVVRKCTGSPLAAALFGAILLAGFCLVVFPIT